MIGTIRSGWQTPAMEHYPTTAELAAFRRELEPADPHSPEGFRYWDAYDYPDRGGAFPHERVNGIGSFDMDVRPGWYQNERATFGMSSLMRRGAAQLRSRAYDAASAIVHSDDPDDWGTDPDA